MLERGAVPGAKLGVTLEGLVSAFPMFPGQLVKKALDGLMVTNAVDPIQGTKPRQYLLATARGMSHTTDSVQQSPLFAPILRELRKGEADTFQLEGLLTMEHTVLLTRLNRLARYGLVETCGRRPTHGSGYTKIWRLKRAAARPAEQSIAVAQPIHIGRGFRWNRDYQGVK